jgi:LmbE family N-acetylglucosaminyl deacetylase
MNKILVVSVHPDDETLGCGGTLLRLRSEGCSLHWLIVTSIYSAQNEMFTTSTSLGENRSWDDRSVKPPAAEGHLVQNRSRELYQVREAYEFSSVYEFCLPAMCLDQIPLNTMVSKFSRVMREVEPDTVFLPFQHDVHSDHRIAFEAAFSCTKSFRYPFIKMILMMETISETDFSIGSAGESFKPNMFVDISEQLDKKVELMALYQGELAEHPFPRSASHIRALALRRGASAHCEYAESFMIIKSIV